MPNILKFIFNRTNINAGVRECHSTPSAVLLDVREVSEYRSGHIPEAVNVPLSAIQTISFPKDTPLFVYCLRGARSRKAVRILKQMGYTDVRSIGGINGYRGEVER